MKNLKFFEFYFFLFSKNILFPTVTHGNLSVLLGKEFHQTEIDTIISAADVKKNGVIDFEEFLLLMRGAEEEAGEEEEREVGAEGEEESKGAVAVAADEVVLETPKK